MLESICSVCGSRWNKHSEWQKRNCAEHDTERIKQALPFLNVSFLEAMNELGDYGNQKYGPMPARREDHKDTWRASSCGMMQHARMHFYAYWLGEKHDHFNTRRHQLAAVAFNAMMEFHFAELEHEA